MKKATNASVDAGRSKRRTMRAHNPDATIRVTQGKRGR